MLTLNNYIQKAIQGIHKHMENWRKYQHLWKQDRTAILSKFVSKSPTAGFFEKKLEKYNTVRKVASNAHLIPLSRARLIYSIGELVEITVLHHNKQ